MFIIMRRVFIIAVIVMLVLLLLSTVTGVGEEIRHSATQYAVLFSGFGYTVLFVLTKRKKDTIG
ncbi:MAG: Group-specific protein [Shouchella clausii]|jgi:predicted small secreted protein